MALNPHQLSQTHSASALQLSDGLDRRVFSRKDMTIHRLLAKRPSRMPLEDGASQNEYLVICKEDLSGIPFWVPAEFFSASTLRTLDVDLPVFSPFHSDSSEEEEEEPVQTTADRETTPDEPVVLRRAGSSGVRSRRGGQMGEHLRSLKRTSSRKSSSSETYNNSSLSDSSESTSSDESESNVNSSSAPGEDTDNADVDERMDVDSDDDLDGFVASDDGPIERRSWTPDRGLLAGFPSPPKDKRILKDPSKAKDSNPTKVSGAKPQKRVVRPYGTSGRKKLTPDPPSRAESPNLPEPAPKSAYTVKKVKLTTPSSSEDD